VIRVVANEALIYAAGRSGFCQDVPEDKSDRRSMFNTIQGRELAPLGPTCIAHPSIELLKPPSFQGG
jgi:hypothetical protein